MEDRHLGVDPAEVGNIAWGTVFCFSGAVACALAAARRFSGARILVWLGVWSGLYGARLLLSSTAVAFALPPLLRPALPLADVACSYLIVVFALLAWMELSRGWLRRVLQALTAAGTAVGIAGIGWFVAGGSGHAFAAYNTLVAVAGLLVLVTVVAAKPLSDRFLILVDHRVLTFGTLAFAAEALYANLARPLRLWHAPALDSLGFAALLFAFAAVAATLIFGNERRLLAIESELDTARRIQASTLPSDLPALDGVRLSAAYRPMAAVAGDFYHFRVEDRHRAGILVADVTGHGVPAALVASMLKIAVRSANSEAEDPGSVLHDLNRMLTGVLDGQYVTAAYLWIDSEAMTARYSAAGHPPLLHWSQARQALTPILSNGLLFGMVPEAAYPVRGLALEAGDRLLLCTDGLLEPEDANGEPFGDRRLEEVVRACQARPAGELSARLLEELRAWQPPGPQQDDITLVVVDVVQGGACQRSLAC